MRSPTNEAYLLLQWPGQMIVWNQTSTGCELKMLGNRPLVTLSPISTKEDATLCCRARWRNSTFLFHIYHISFHWTFILFRSPPITVGEWFAQSVARNFSQKALATWVFPQSNVPDLEISSFLMVIVMSLPYSIREWWHVHLGSSPTCPSVFLPRLCYGTDSGMK